VYDQDLLKKNDEIDDKIYWRWTIQIIEDEWLRFSMRFIDDKIYWRWDWW
jgi:hypothetical protein